MSLTRWHIDGEQGQLLKNDELHGKITPWPGMLGSKSINWIRVGRKLNSASGATGGPPRAGATAPPRGGAEQRQDPSLWHFTNQTLSFLAKKLSPSVVTVHDIIELLEPQDKKAYWLNRYLYSGIKRATHIIAVSEYTKKTIQEHLNIPAEKITVIHNGVGPEFHPLPRFKETIAYQNLRHELRLPTEAKVILTVGSDHPRKNVITALRAVAAAQKSFNVPLIFLKVGAPGLPGGRAEFISEVNRLSLTGSVRLIDTVSVGQLNELYNLADVVVFPSRFEGFGLPPLQAMAAGTPVLAARSSSLPEVVGEAGLLHEVEDSEGLAALLLQVLTDAELSARLRQQGQQRAHQFSWEAAADKVATVYRSLGE